MNPTLNNAEASVQFQSKDINFKNERSTDSSEMSSFNRTKDDWSDWDQNNQRNITKTVYVDSRKSEGSNHGNNSLASNTESSSQVRKVHE